MRDLNYEETFTRRAGKCRRQRRAITFARSPIVKSCPRVEGRDLTPVPSIPHIHYVHPPKGCTLGITSNFAPVSRSIEELQRSHCTLLEKFCDPSPDRS